MGIYWIVSNENSHDAAPLLFRVRSKPQFVRCRLPEQLFCTSLFNLQTYEETSLRDVDRKKQQAKSSTRKKIYYLTSTFRYDSQTFSQLATVVSFRMNVYPKPIQIFNK